MTEYANTERMIAEGWLFRCEVCGCIGDWVCSCPDGRPTTTLADAARSAAARERSDTGRRDRLNDPLREEPLPNPTTETGEI